MKAIFHDRYGGPETLSMRNLPTPTPARGELLVAVRAVSVNLTDWEFLTGRPAYARINGLFRPAKPVPGSDIAGVVQAVGPGVTRFSPGDAVMGDALYTQGGFAEFAVVREADFIAKPEALSFAQAATIPQAAVIAHFGISVKGRVRKGQKILINGAGGGSGMFAIQFAKARGAHVTGVDSAPKHELMRSLGADEVIDHAATDFARTDARYDLILDLVATRSASAVARALRPGGTYFAVGGSVRRTLSILVLGGLMSPLIGRRIRVLAVQPGAEVLEEVTAQIVDSGLRLAIERCYPLELAADALAHHGAGLTLGKVVVTVGNVD